MAKQPTAKPKAQRPNLAELDYEGVFTTDKDLGDSSEEFVSALLKTHG